MLQLLKPEEIWIIEVDLILREKFSRKFNLQAVYRFGDKVRMCKK
jgi:hypothetical protein